MAIFGLKASFQKDGLGPVGINFSKPLIHIIHNRFKLILLISQLSLQKSKLLILETLLP